MRSLPLLAFTLLLPLAAQASPESDFAGHAAVLPQQALQAGYRRFGSLDLGDFIARLGTIQVTSGKVGHQQKDFGPFDVERDGAEWSRGSAGGPRLKINPATWLRAPSRTKAMLGFHEALGALGYEDDNFGCSASVQALVDPNARATFTADERRTFESFADRGCQRVAGGSTVVTGGGDDFNVNIRLKIIDQTTNEMRQARDGAARSAAFQGLSSSLYSGYGRNRSRPMVDTAHFMESVRLQRRPVVESIRVRYDDREVPMDPRNGWTYDARTNRVLLHGNAIPRKRPGDLGIIGPGVYCQWAD